MAAAHSTPTTFAVTTLRRRNSPSGSSGESARVSIRRNTPSSAAVTMSRPIVRTEPQPTRLPSMIAYTAITSAAVTVTEPATSSRPAPP